MNIVRALGCADIDRLHKTVGDICLTVFRRLSDEEVTKTFGSKVDLSDSFVYEAVYVDDVEDEEAAFKEAIDNTLDNLSPIKAKILANLIDDLDKITFLDLFSDKAAEEIEKNRSVLMSGLVVTSDSFIGGATAIFIPEVSKRVYDLLGEEYYIAFTSIYESIVHPVSTIDDLSIIRETLSEMKNCPDNEEVLSYNVFKYNASTNSIEMVEE